MTSGLPPWSIHAQGDPVAPSPPCGCNHCGKGLTNSLHNHISHDQRREQTFALGEQSLHIFGGTTKCARLTLGYALAHPQEFSGKKILELGAGAGLVGLGLALALPCDVTLTDQAPVCELLEDNLKANLNSSHHHAKVLPLQWGSSNSSIRSSHYDIIIGADLNFAEESLPLLTETLLAITDSGQTIYLATIQRADWEERLFTSLKRQFQCDVIADDNEVQLRKYWNKNSRI